MAEDWEDIESQEEELSEDAAASGKFDKLLGSDSHRYKLSGMFREWYLDYASYTILDRAVPHIVDGLKPVQRRVLHTMGEMEDGRYTKVANIVGQAMQYHPHGDASILGALVTLGQKGLLIDCQGNWGNIFTGDSNAAPRYIEARLTKFAKEVVFDRKVTPWMTSYDGRKQEPSELTKENVMVGWIDALTISSVMMLLFYLLNILTREGAFDILSYSFKLVWFNTFYRSIKDTKLPRTYREYREQRRGAKKDNVLFLLVGAAPYLVAGIVVAIIYYSQIA